MRGLGIAVVCVDARHAKGVRLLRVNKTDRNDALGLAHPADSRPRQAVTTTAYRVLDQS